MNCQNESPTFANQGNPEKLALEFTGRNIETVYQILLSKESLYLAEADTQAELKILINSGEAFRGDELRMNARLCKMILLCKHEEVVSVMASGINNFTISFGQDKHVSAASSEAYLLQILKKPESVYAFPNVAEGIRKGSDIRMTPRGITLYNDERKVVYSTLAAGDYEADWRFGRNPEEEDLIDQYFLRRKECCDSFELLSRESFMRDTDEYKEAKTKYLKRSAELDATKDALRAINSYFLELI